MSVSHSISDARRSIPSWDELVRVLTLEEYNTRVVVLGVMALGTAAGLVGTFLLLRKRALTADALSHATLPGIAIAFMVMVSFGGDGKTLVGLLLGAFVFGCVGVLANLPVCIISHTNPIQRLHRRLSIAFAYRLTPTNFVIPTHHNNAKRIDREIPID